MSSTTWTVLLVSDATVSVTGEESVAEALESSPGGSQVTVVDTVPLPEGCEAKEQVKGSVTVPSSPSATAGITTSWPPLTVHDTPPPRSEVTATSAVMSPSS